ncbi:MAG TPA: hypothetical protein VJV03_17735, partial [Pyrinomonadaceae bacterium]|nr:hypothetical protein [Pyrinomonadaceae bacterium]
VRRAGKGRPKTVGRKYFARKPDWSTLLPTIKEKLRRVSTFGSPSNHSFKLRAEQIADSYLIAFLTGRAYKLDKVAT